MLKLLTRFYRDERAATSVEYALIGVVMAVMLIVALPPIRDQLTSLISQVTSAFQVALG